MKNWVKKVGSANSPTARTSRARSTRPGVSARHDASRGSKQAGGEGARGLDDGGAEHGCCGRWIGSLGGEERCVL